MPPRLARLLAVLAAVVLVAGAFVLRGVLGGDDGPSGPAGDRPDPAGDAGQAFRILCDDDLGEACTALAAAATGHEVEVARLDDALDRLTGEELAYDAWLTLDPWPDELAAAVPTLPVTDPVGVASSVLAVLADPPRSECTPTTDWDCLTAAVTPPVGIASSGTAVGSLSLAHAAAALQGSTDFGINRLEDDVRVALQDLVRLGGPDRDTAAQASAILQPGPYSAVVTTVARAESEAGTPQGQRRGLEVAALAPEARIGVVLAGLGARGPAAVDALRGPVTDQTVRDALAAEGWTGPAGRTTGLPTVRGVVYALQEMFA